MADEPPNNRVTELETENASLRTELQIANYMLADLSAALSSAHLRQARASAQLKLIPPTA